MILYNLGSLLRLQGELIGARVMLERALQLDRINLGENHPDVARDLGQLALAVNALGDEALAQQYTEQRQQILRTREQDPQSGDLVSRVIATET
jgi:tetratricopeptide (TPR) repeat protein